MMAYILAVVVTIGAFWLFVWSEKQRRREKEATAIIFENHGHFCRQLGRMVQVLRSRSVYSAAEVAAGLGLSNAMYQALEAGQLSVDEKIIDRVCQFFALAPDWSGEDDEDLPDLAEIIEEKDEDSLGRAVDECLSFIEPLEGGQ